MAIKLFAQDTIYMVDNSKIIGHVISKIEFNITYLKSMDCIDRFPRVVSKRSVRLIAYADGSFEIFSVRKINPQHLKDYPMFMKGCHDAEKYYNHSCGAVGTGLTSFFSGGILGLVPAIICSASNPKVYNLDIPVGAPLKNKDYILGYIYKAKKMKQIKVWRGYSAGVVGALAFALLVIHA